jgi:PIN domain nuclease of toxin-antitoxin system
VKLLLDTHVVLWLLGDPDRIAVAVRRDIEDVSNAVIIATKHAIGKLPLPESPQALLDRAVVELRAVELAITRRHALRSASLPSHHRDPFDRLLVAQALLEEATLVTADHLLPPYGVALLWAA